MKNWKKVALNSFKNLEKKFEIERLKDSLAAYAPISKHFCSLKIDSHWVNWKTRRVNSCCTVNQLLHKVTVRKLHPNFLLRIPACSKKKCFWERTAVRRTLKCWLSIESDNCIDHTFSWYFSIKISDNTVASVIFTLY